MPRSLLPQPARRASLGYGRQTGRLRASTVPRVVTPSTKGGPRRRLASLAHQGCTRRSWQRRLTRNANRAHLACMPQGVLQDVGLARPTRTRTISILDAWRVLHSPRPTRVHLWNNACALGGISATHSFSAVYTRLRVWLVRLESTRLRSGLRHACRAVPVGTVPAPGRTARSRRCAFHALQGRSRPLAEAGDAPDASGGTTWPNLGRLRARRVQWGHSQTGRAHPCAARVLRGHSM